MQAYTRTIYNTTQYHMTSNNFDRSFVMLTQKSKHTGRGEHLRQNFPP